MRFRDTSQALEQVKRAFVAFLAGDLSWRQEFTWVPLGQGPAQAAHQCDHRS